MSELQQGTLEVGLDKNNQVIINHPELPRDEHGVAHIVFSGVQALGLADLLCKNAAVAIGAGVQPFPNNEARSQAAVALIKSASGEFYGNPHAGFFYALNRIVVLENLLQKCLDSDTMDKDHILGEGLVADIQAALDSSPPLVSSPQSPNSANRRKSFSRRSYGVPVESAFLKR
jgi:hypothetical protein